MTEAVNETGLIERAFKEAYALGFLEGYSCEPRYTLADLDDEGVPAALLSMEGVSEAWSDFAADRHAAALKSLSPLLVELALCEDCPPVGYPTDKTRCSPCPRRSPPLVGDERLAEAVKRALDELGGLKLALAHLGRRDVAAHIDRDICGPLCDALAAPPPDAVEVGQRMQEALEFYASEWCDPDHEIEPSLALLQDCGERARQALTSPPTPQSGGKQ